MDTLLWTVTMRHDRGTVNITTAAPDADTARELVCKAERAPSSAAVRVFRSVRIAWSQTITGDGDPDAGEDSSERTGWFCPWWSQWTTFDDLVPDMCSVYEPLVFDADEHDETETVVQWLAHQMNEHLEELPQLPGVGGNGQVTSVYGGSYEHPYEDKRRAPVAHPEGFTADEVMTAVRAVRARYGY